MTDPFEITEPKPLVMLPTATVLAFTGHKRDANVHDRWEGALYMCCVCKGAEGALPTHCPGLPIDEEKGNLIMSGILDYKDGKWVQL